MSETMLRRSTDRKVTNAFRMSKTDKPVAIGANSFGLPSGEAFSCPGQTSICAQICYAGKLEKIYSGVRAILMHNWNLLKDATYPEMVSLLQAMVDEFVSETKAQRAKGIAATYDFRIHWDGDFFSMDYASAWGNVAMSNPNVQFWVYTRSFTEDLNVLPAIAGIGNLTVYLSADAENVDRAHEMAKRFPSVHIAYLGNTFADAKAIGDDSRKGYDCPENAKRLPLIGPKGSACTACGICIVGRGDVRFSKTKK